MKFLRQPLRQRTSYRASLRALRIPLALYLGANLVDTVATLIAIGHGAVELNPLAALPLRTLGAPAFVAVKLAVAFATMPAAVTLHRYLL
jgi:hypothetical protein